MVSVNMASSIDGKIASRRRGAVKLGTAYDSKRMREIRAEHQIVVMGAQTFLATPRYLGLPTAIVSSRLDFPARTPWENANDKERWVFCGKNAPQQKIRRLEKNGVKVVQSRAPRPSAREILGACRKAGFKRVLLEGGGELNAAFFAAGLIDRIFLTLTPWIIGGREAPTICDGEGFLPGKFQRWKLTECKRVKQELYLRFTR